MADASGGPAASSATASALARNPTSADAKGLDRPTTGATVSSGILTHSQVASRQRQRSMLVTEAADAAKREEEEEELRKLRRELMARTALADERVTDDNRNLLVLVHEYREKYEAQTA